MNIYLKPIKEYLIQSHCQDDPNKKAEGDLGLRFLYELLASREPIQNISHQAMPSYEEHLKYCANFNKDIGHLFLIGCSEVMDEDMAWHDLVGSIYITFKNEIGIHIAKPFQGRGLGKEAYELLTHFYPRKQYLANINPANKNSIRFFEQLGFSHIQNTYALTPKK